MATIRASADTAPERHGRSRVALQVGLSLLAAGIFAFRAVRTAVEDSPFEGTLLVAGVVLASLAAVLCLGAALLVRRPPVQAAVLLGSALLLELLVVGLAAPPRLVSAFPLLFALALAVTPARPAASASRTARGVATVVAVVLMVPVGWFYLTAGLVVPVPWLLGVYLLFAVQVVGVVRLASRRSWWVLVTPFVAAATLFAVVWAGTTFLGWTP